MFKGLEGSERVALLVVTRPGGEWSAADVDAYNEDSPRRLKALLRRLRRAAPGTAYFWTGELQRNGSVHFNILLRGFPYAQRDALGAWVAAAGFGPRFSINLLRREGVPGVTREGVGKAGAYITKAVSYIAKGAPGWMGRRNLYGCSRDWAPEFEDWSKPKLEHVVHASEVGGLATVLRGTRREFVAAGLPVPAAGVMFPSEADGVGAWLHMRSAAASALCASLRRLEALRASERAPVPV